jgi:uncharacterized membrane protein YsdA (DUF1294 family)
MAPPPTAPSVELRSSPIAGVQRRPLRRVPNAALRLLALLGGALGGWAGMLVWRHKTRHTRFWIAQIAGTAVIVIALWLLR